MNLCYFIAAPLYRRRQGQVKATAQDLHHSPQAYWRWQFDSSVLYFDKFWDLKTQLAGRRVLDIGCGLGGRACYLATIGAGEVVGIDINASEIRAARQLADAKLSPDINSKLKFIHVQDGEPAGEEIARSPFPLEGRPPCRPPGRSGFDIALLVDSLEHVRDPVAMLNLAYDYLSPEGLCYFGTVGWYHYNAAHLMSILPVPFLTLLFREQTILDAVRRMLQTPFYVPTMWDSVPPVARWEGVTDLGERPGEHLNRITIRGMRDAVQRSRFGGGQLRVTGFSFGRRPWLRWMNILAAVPGIQEAYHSGCFGRLVR
jgi:SAM-dependent methyltransferase